VQLSLIQEDEHIMMVCRRRSGFTLIELLVVIAIIAILAAMLFPVFARARESARKIQCLSNVKNIAIAVQMYLTDYDRFPPGLHNAAEVAYFDTAPGGGNWDPDAMTHCNRRYQANPYLRWPVIFDEYTRNRDVWKCPSTRSWKGATWIVPNYGKGYADYLQQTEGKWGRAASPDCGGGPCGLAWPVGWGGTVTDSIVQVTCGSADSNAAEMNIGWVQSYDIKTSQIGDPSWTVVCGDSAKYVNILDVDSMLYHFCRTGCGADWANCPETIECGLDASLVDRWPNDPSLRAKYVRHLGGVNVGFADGHASWFSGEALQALAPYCIEDCSCQNIDSTNRPVRGLCPLGTAL
jgi:prepilin-type N-terminal cleavage/methylation domain-containing protein/prepilin-type processing-associated H-X9-DG protein